MAKKVLFVIFLVYFSYFSECSELKECVKEDACVCRFNEHVKIDLKGLFSNSKNTSTKFLHDSEGNFTFYFHGCEDANFILKDYNLGNTSQILLATTLVSAEQYVKTVKLIDNTTISVIDYTVTELARSSNILFNTPEDGAVQLIFKTSNGIAATMRLVCENYDTYLKIRGDPKQTPIDLILNSPAACLIVENRSISTGTTLLIMVFTFAAIYFFGGAAALYFLRGARGMEMIPNVDFWRGLPGLVKDGAVFLCSGCQTSNISTAETYDRI